MTRYTAAKHAGKVELVHLNGEKIENVIECDDASWLRHHTRRQDRTGNPPDRKDCRNPLPSQLTPTAGLP
ncbi:hypothetical protein PhaeoP18_01541 [Phaeobacter piscinae]|uniref:hypothetical protein n=1 Tax=Phaeobacter piscinae TaxID=1580596 RepID=UPI000CA2BF13|nr:hypothetical protein [Phaeobacter piscinae]AUR35815.1 hypothetical protein PhaeoP18_01541 [Phaeobacter piscinae]